VIVATADSNIYVSALNFGGVPLEFLNAARAGYFRLIISESLIAETSNVLRGKFGWPENLTKDAIAELLNFAVLVTPTETIDYLKTDPDDNRVLECAVASDSRYVVSGDKHLLVLGEYQGIRILKVTEFLPLVARPSAPTR
jgi:putative PIN family toxin of toxin-antitoxin system